MKKLVSSADFDYGGKWQINIVKYETFKRFLRDEARKFYAAKAVAAKKRARKKNSKKR